MAIKATPADIGKRVVYVRNHKDPPERGYITSVSSCFVFVRYDGDQGSKATLAVHLDWPGSHPLRTPDPTPPASSTEGDAG